MPFSPFFFNIGVRGGSSTPNRRSRRSAAPYYIHMAQRAHAGANSSPTPHSHADIRTSTCTARHGLFNGPGFAGVRRSARALGRLQCSRQLNVARSSPNRAPVRATRRRLRLELGGPSKTIDPTVSDLRGGLSAGGSGSSGSVRLHRSQRCSARAGKRHRQVARRAGLAGWDGTGGARFAP